MSVPRLAFTSIAVALILLVSVISEAQLGGLLKKKLQKPAAPGEPASPASPGARPPYCAGITDEKINQYLKAKEVQKQVLQKEAARANARKADAAARRADAEALATKRAERMVSTMAATGECTDTFKEKDPRSKNIARLEDLVAAANERGEDAKAEEIQKELSALSDTLEVDADRACGGRGAAALHDCRGKKKAALAKAGVTEPMLSVQAQAECMQDPSTSGFAGATAASAEEEAATAEERAATEEAAELFRIANANADKAGADAAGLTRDEFNQLDHCIRSVLGGNLAAPTTPESTAAINRRSAELKAALR
jgi:hypothetical protein